MGASNARRPSLGLVDTTVLVRVASAAVGIPIIVALVLVGGPIFRIVVIVVGLVAAWEAFRMLRVRGHKPAVLFVMTMTALLAVAPGSSNYRLWWQATLVVGAMAAGLWTLLSADGADSFLDWVLTVVVALYAGGLIGFLSGIRLLDNGMRLLLLVLILNWAYDTGAYFAGKTIGKTPFMSHISASKTWEGVGGGIALCVVAGLALALPMNVNLGTAALLAVVVAVAAQLGDLVESLMKRYCEVKDSGTLIPGHGGLLDRIDSLLFSGAAAYYLLLLAGYR